jgi:cytoskeleton protein RodZ
VTQANGTSSATTTATEAVADDRYSSVANLGDKLRLAREQRSLSLADVSEALHLDETIIVSLEQGHFETLGAPVYVRGHLKTYARLLGLSSDEIISEYQRDSPEPFTAPILQQPGVVDPVAFNPVLLAGGGLTILLGLLLGLYVLFGDADPGDVVAQDRVVVPVVDTADRTMPEVVESVSTAPGLPAEPDTRRAAAEPKIVAKPPQPVVTPVVVDVASPPASVDRPAATMRLGLQFTQESWVEISDANRRLLFGLQREGDRREISGEPPFNLLIGNARAVELTVNDEPFDVPAARVRGKVARFKITGEETE